MIRLIRNGNRRNAQQNKAAVGDNHCVTSMNAKEWGIVYCRYYGFERIDNELHVYVKASN